MQEAVVQPNASRISETLVSTILRTATGTHGETPSYTISHYGEYSNDLAAVQLADGQMLMIKRGRYPWSDARMRNSRLAAELIRQHTDILAPRSLELRRELDHGPLDVYWRIELPTLSDCWLGLPVAGRREAMRSLGRMIRRIHEIQLPGHGDLSLALTHPVSLSQVLVEDLDGRLMPAVASDWPEAVPLLQFLLDMVPVVVRRAPAESALLHGDLHLGNVLCRGEGTDFSCVGVLDLENALGGPKESDLARLAVMHTNLFDRPLDGPWFEWVLEGYDAEVDPLLLRFYGLCHMVNLGYISALIGYDWHAGQVAAAARDELAALRAMHGGDAAGQRLSTSARFDC